MHLVLLIFLFLAWTSLDAFFHDLSPFFFNTLFFFFSIDSPSWCLYLFCLLFVVVFGSECVCVVLTHLKVISRRPPFSVLHRHFSAAISVKGKGKSSSSAFSSHFLLLFGFPLGFPLWPMMILRFCVLVWSVGQVLSYCRLAVLPRDSLSIMHCH